MLTGSQIKFGTRPAFGWAIYLCLYRSCKTAGHCGSLPATHRRPVKYPMTKTSPHSARQAIQGLIVAALAALGMHAQAQFTPAAASTPAGLAAQTGVNPAAAVAMPGVPTLAAPPVVGPQPPVMAPRPDLGAADAQRAAVQPLRAPKPQVPSQFQRFVQESTGKLLPNFGTQLFENPQAYAADAAAPAPGEYVLGPGDEVRIQCADHGSGQS